MFQIAI